MPSEPLHEVAPFDNTCYACGEPWPCPNAVDSHSGVPVEGPADAVLAVLSDEGWVADPDAIDYNLRVADLVARAALAAAPREASEPLLNTIEGQLRDIVETHPHAEGWDDERELEWARNKAAYLLTEVRAALAPREAKTPGERE